MGFLESIVKKSEAAKKAKANKTHSDPWIRFNVEQTIDDSAYNANFDYYKNKKCPNCEEALKQEEKKSNCPGCKQAIFTERHFKTKKQMLLTKEQAAQYEVEVKHYKDLKWALQLATEFRLTEKEMKQMVGARKTNVKFAALWVVANEISMDYARRSKWLSYRNTRLSMGDILFREGQSDKALGFYLTVCFIDLNGPSDEGTFDSHGASLKSGVLQTISKITKELEMDEETVKDQYLSIAQLEKNRLMPLTPEETWAIFLKEYKKKQNS